MSYSQLMIVVILCTNVLMLILTFITLNIVKTIVAEKNKKVETKKHKKEGNFNKSLGVRELN